TCSPSSSEPAIWPAPPRRSTCAGAARRALARSPAGSFGILLRTGRAPSRRRACSARRRCASRAPVPAPADAGRSRGCRSGGGVHGLDPLAANLIDSVAQGADVGGELFQLLPCDGEVGVVPGVDVGVLEELEEAVVLRGAAGEDVTKKG